jgi:hypothetical protein
MMRRRYDRQNALLSILSYITIIGPSILLRVTGFAPYAKNIIKEYQFIMLTDMPNYLFLCDFIFYNKK